MFSLTAMAILNMRHTYPKSQEFQISFIQVDLAVCWPHLSLYLAFHLVFDKDKMRKAVFSFPSPLSFSSLPVLLIFVAPSLLFQTDSHRPCN